MMEMKYVGKRPQRETKKEMGGADNSKCAKGERGELFPGGETPDDVKARKRRHEGRPGSHLVTSEGCD
ncbi:unnamed protein product [Timema podura]|uniref:Uncharacterized protein n=1 Tax=Timema podura TaxID=61482 RepID=A0ABN7PNN5_TIMPD|nr:unnamed protein product [Timema podura]